jgi:hypothetical protein
MSDFRVSDHALVRYIERVQKINLDPLRKEITDKVEIPAMAGAARVTVDGVVFEVRDRTVVTIADTDSIKKFRRSPPNKHRSNRGAGHDPDQHERQKRLARAGGLLR